MITNKTNQDWVPEIGEELQMSVGCGRFAAVKFMAEYEGSFIVMNLVNRNITIAGRDEVRRKKSEAEIKREEAVKEMSKIMVVTGGVFVVRDVAERILDAGYTKVNLFSDEYLKSAAEQLNSNEGEYMSPQAAFKAGARWAELQILGDKS